MRAIFLALCLAVLNPVMANAQTCHTDSVSTSPGGYLFTTSGQKFKIWQGDTRISTTWLPLDKLNVCPKGGNAYEITNLSRKGQQVLGLYFN